MVKPRRTFLLYRCAAKVQSFFAARDARVLVFTTAALSLLAWFLPPQGLFCLFIPACVLAAVAALVLPRGRSALAAYIFFSLTWAVSWLFLYLFEHPGDFAPALEGAFLLGCRLFTLLGLALVVPMTVTALTLGRVLAWSLHFVASAEQAVCTLLFRNKIRPRLENNIWRAALALILMTAFFPRALQTLSDLRCTLRTRAPNLPLHRRAGLLALAALRILSAQTWNMAFAIASRDLYRPLPWQWRR